MHLMYARNESRSAEDCPAARGRVGAAPAPLSGLGSSCRGRGRARGQSRSAAHDTRTCTHTTPAIRTQARCTCTAAAYTPASSAAGAATSSPPAARDDRVAPPLAARLRAGPSGASCTVGDACWRGNASRSPRATVGAHSEGSTTAPASPCRCPGRDDTRGITKHRHATMKHHKHTMLVLANAWPCYSTLPEASPDGNEPEARAG